MRTTTGVLLTLGFLGLLALAAAQIGPSPSSSPTDAAPAQTSSSIASTGGPSSEPVATSSKGTLFTSDPKASDSVKPASSRSDTDWQYLWLKASVVGVHFNLNQKAKNADSGADNWTRIFHEPAPFRDLDGIYFCGPVNTFDVKVADSRDWSLVYTGTLNGVPPC